METLDEVIAKAKQSKGFEPAPQQNELDAVILGAEGDGLTPEVSVKLNFDSPLGVGPSPETTHRQNLQASGYEVIEDFKGRRHIIPKAPDLTGQAGQFAAGAWDAVKGVGSTLQHTPELLYEAMTKPARFGLEVGGQLINHLGDQAGKMIFGNELEQARAFGQSTAQNLIGEIPGAVSKGITSAKTLRALRADANLMKLDGKVAAAQGITDGLPFDYMQTWQNVRRWVRQYIQDTAATPALAERKGYLMRKYFSPDSGKATEEFYNIIRDMSDDFYTRNYDSIAEPFRDAIVDTQQLASGLRSFANGDYVRTMQPGIKKELDRIADYFDTNRSFGQLEEFRRNLNKMVNPKGEIPKAYMDEFVDGIRGTIDNALDTFVERSMPTSNALRTYRDMANIRDVAKERVKMVRAESAVQQGKHWTFVPTFVTETGIKASLIRQGLKAVESGRNHPDNLLREFYRGVRNSGPGDFGGEPQPIVILRYQRQLAGRGQRGSEGLPSGSGVSEPSGPQIPRDPTAAPLVTPEPLESIKARVDAEIARERIEALEDPNYPMRTRTGGIRKALPPKGGFKNPTTSVIPSEGEERIRRLGEPASYANYDTPIPEIVSQGPVTRRVLQSGTISADALRLREVNLRTGESGTIIDRNGDYLTIKLNTGGTKIVPIRAVSD